MTQDELNKPFGNSEESVEESKEPKEEVKKVELIMYLLEVV